MNLRSQRGIVEHYLNSHRAPVNVNKGVRKPSEKYTIYNILNWLIWHTIGECEGKIILESF